MGSARDAMSPARERNTNITTPGFLGWPSHGNTASSMSKTESLSTKYSFRGSNLCLCQNCRASSAQVDFDVTGMSLCGVEKFIVWGPTHKQIVP